MNKGKRLIVTLMSSGMATAMSFVVSFFLTPFITNMLGTEAYGFVTLSKNFVSYAVIISTALDSYATRYIAMEYHKRDFDKANSYVSSAFYGDTVIASIILAVGVIFVLFMERFLNVSPELLVSVKLLFLLVFVNFFFTTIKTVFNSTAYIKNRLDITGFVRVIGYVVEIILYLVIFKLFPPRVWYVGIVMLVVTAINFLAAIWMFHNMTPELKVERKLFSMDAVKKLVGDGIWNSINSLGVTLNWTGFAGYKPTSYKFADGSNCHYEDDSIYFFIIGSDALPAIPAITSKKLLG